MGGLGGVCRVKVCRVKVDKRNALYEAFCGKLYPNYLCNFSLNEMKLSWIEHKVYMPF